jgi:hypothetical protein
VNYAQLKRLIYEIARLEQQAQDEHDGTLLDTHGGGAGEPLLQRDSSGRGYASGTTALVGAAAALHCVVVLNPFT